MEVDFVTVSTKFAIGFCQFINEVRFVLDQHAELDCYGASSLKQKSAGRHVAPLGHIILIPSQPICGEATNSNFIVFGLT
jgi:hypothetical protein